jgi:hypothetical protein
LRRYGEGGEFRLSERYAQLTSMLFTCVMFGAAMPLLIPLVGRCRLTL